MVERKPLERRDYLKILAISGIIAGPLIIGLLIQNM